MSSKVLFRFFLSLVFLCVLCVTVTFMKAIELMNLHENSVNVKESIGNIAVSAMKSTTTEPLEHESMFTDTLKDCMPTIEKNPKKKKKECKTFIPEGSKERIAILAPPGKLDSGLLKFINIVLTKGRKGEDGEVAATQVEVISSTNMAPYGYGKTHGYTRIIRVVPQPLLLGATDTLKAALKSSSSSPPPLPPSISLNDITLNDLKAALRQQVRYHCRLNHIAAHTAMWTIGAEDFAEIGRDWLVETAQDFFGLDLEQEELFNEVNSEYEKLFSDDDDENKVIIENENDDNALVELDHIFAESSRLVSLLQMKTNTIEKKAKTKNATNILKVLDDVLLDEMRLSNNLTAWPCESFWTVGEPENRLELSPIIRSISKAMSPNCTAPYTSCFVKKDKCEAQGNGICKG